MNLSKLQEIVKIREAFYAAVHGDAESNVTWQLNDNKDISYKDKVYKDKNAATAVTAAESLQSCPTLCDPIDGSPPGSPSLGLSRQEHWSGLPFPSPMHESEK